VSVGTADLDSRHKAEPCASGGNDSFQIEPYEITVLERRHNILMQLRVRLMEEHVEGGEEE